MTFVFVVISTLFKKRSCFVMNLISSNAFKVSNFILYFFISCFCKGNVNIKLILPKANKFPGDKIGLVLS